MRVVGNPSSPPLSLADIMPWAVPPLRLGRGWIVAPEAVTLRARWDRLVRAEPDEREALFEPTRSRSLRSAVAQLPGHPAPDGRLLSESGPCPEPVRVAAGGPFDRQWLIPDPRLIDAARPELWRVADDTRQLYAIEHPEGLAYTALLPAGLPGRIRPLYRRPGGLDPNLAPGLLDHLCQRLGLPVAPEDVLAWTAVFGAPDVVLTADAALWTEGVALGRQVLWLHTYGSRCGTGSPPRMPGGQRPYVRAPIPALPASLDYDPDEQALHLGTGVVSPVPASAWPALQPWCERRFAPGSPGSPGWPRSRTSELLELVTVVALLDGLTAHRGALAARADDAEPIAPAELHAAGVLPVPGSARRPASVLDFHEEGPDGQFALL
ncbi:type ISP restriction/modification enzyme [Streptomyces sp. NBC_01262]|uniref:type ISP restriction/modification enzyme n=1 Tax=Streptomyces sp. NBC_01262 TaxID=2903803 RepID=UPI003FCC8F39